MNTLGAKDCLVVATVWCLIAVAINVDAQEPQADPQETQTDPQETQTEQQPQQQQQPLRKLFVSDKLVLNVYAEPDQGSSRVATIQTGDAVDELERAENFIRVRLESGSEGWVGSNYLTSEVPAAARLRELQREQKGGQQAVDKKAAEEIARLKKESAALQAQVNELKSVAAAEARAVVENSSGTQSEEAAQDGEPMEEASPIDARGIPWAWAFAVVLAGGLGFAGGYQTLAGRIRKKFGGLRIY